MNNILDLVVSVFQNYRGIAKNITLGEMFRRIKEGYYKDLVEDFRREIGALKPFSPEFDRKKRDLKANHPTFTPMCQIKEGFVRSDANIAKMHCIVCHDLDAKDQADPEAFCRDFKEKASRLPYIFYIADSLSKMGFFTISVFCSDNPKRDYKRAFTQIRDDFSAMGYVTDKAASSISNHRFVSCDENPYENLQAQPLPLLGYDPEEAERYQKQPQYLGVRPAVNFSSGEDDYAKVERKLREENVSNSIIDYEDWRDVGFAFANTFGEAGRPLYHLFSAHFEKYNPVETDYKYSNYLSTTKRLHTLGTFFFIWKKYK